MTCKQFFKSNAFKCLIVLTVAALIAGGVLAILNDLLHVSDEERTQRAIKKIYGAEVDYITLEVDPDGATNEFGTIDEIFGIEGNYLIKATGDNGYKGGTITLWIVAKMENGAFAGLEKVTVAGNEKQTLMGNLNNAYLAKYTTDNEKILAGGYFDITESAENSLVISSGATKSSNAANRAVNCALVYIRNVLTTGGTL